MYLKILSKDVDFYAFSISEAIVEYKEGDYIKINPLYIPSILRELPLLHQNFKEGKDTVFLEDNEEVSYPPVELKYGATFQSSFYKDGLLYGRYSVPDAATSLKTYGDNADQKKRWRIKEDEVNEERTYEGFAILKFIGEFDVDNDILCRGFRYKNLSENDNGEN